MTIVIHRFFGGNCILGLVRSSFGNKLLGTFLRKSFAKLAGDIAALSRIASAW